jgi:hypothetical protein
MTKTTALCKPEFKTSITKWCIIVQLELSLKIRLKCLWSRLRRSCAETKKNWRVRNNTLFLNWQPCSEYIVLLLWFLLQFHSASLEERMRGTVRFFSLQTFALLGHTTLTSWSSLMWANGLKLETSEASVPNYYTRCLYTVTYAMPMLCRRQDNRCPSSDPNWTYLEYKSTVLLLDQPVQNLVSHPTISHLNTQSCNSLKPHAVSHLSVMHNSTKKKRIWSKFVLTEFNFEINWTNGYATHPTSLRFAVIFFF